MANPVRILTLILLSAAIFAGCGDGENPSEPVISDRYRSIVYILPSAVSSPHWHDKYGDRIYFYVHENLDDYVSYIDSDFRKIKSVYNTVIVVIPAEDTELFFNNLRILNSIADSNGLNLLFAIFPKEKYGDEETYLIPGSAMNDLVIQDMDSMAELSRTWKIAVWYGWEDRTNPADVLNFYNSLPENLKDKYAVWLDEEYIEPMEDLAETIPADLLVITEWYQLEGLGEISSIFKSQMIITGYDGAENSRDWLSHIQLLFNGISGKNRLVGIWIFYDRNDGSGESLTAFFPDDSVQLANPWE